MAKFWNKKNKNLVSLISGIILILIGASGASISLLKFGLNSTLIIPPLISFVLGIIFAYIGAKEKWQ